MEFLEHVYQLEIENEEDKAYNKVTRHIESLLSKNRFEVVNSILVDVDINKIEPWVQRAFLVSTYQYKDKLSNRASFFNKVFKEIEILQGTHVATSLVGGLI